MGPESRELRHGIVGFVRSLGQSVAVLNLAVAGAVIAASGAAAGDAVPWAFALAGVGCLCLATVFVRFTKRLASAGGVYTFVSRGLGPNAGFIAGWVYGGAFALAVPVVLAIGASSLSVLLSNYLDWQVGWFACFLALLGVMSAFAFLDVRLSTAVQVVLGAACMLAILVLALVVLGQGGDSGVAVDPFASARPTSAHSLFLGVAFAFAGFLGFEAAAAFGEEASSPRTTIPRAILTAAVLVVVWYVFVAYVMVLGLGVGGSSRWSADIAPFDTLASRYAGTWLAVLADLAVVASSFIAALACTNLNSRTFLAMAREGGLPHIFAWTHPRFRTPWAGIAATLGLALALTIVLGRRWDAPAPAPFPFVQAFALALTIGVLVAYVLVALSALMFFRHGESGGRSRRALLGAAPPLVAIAICSYTIYESVRASPPAPVGYGTWIALGWLVVGITVLSWLIARKPDRVHEFGSILAEGNPGLGPES